MRAWLIAVWRGLWLPAEKPVLRDFVAVWFLLVQGIIRLIDGAWFAVLPTTFLSNMVYGVIQVVLGAWLIVTHSHARRGSAWGRWAAALAAGLFVTLALDVLSRSATSAFPAIGIALVMIAEARYDAAD